MPLDSSKGRTSPCSKGRTCALLLLSVPSCPLVYTLWCKGSPCCLGCSCRSHKPTTTTVASPAGPRSMGGVGLSLASKPGSIFTSIHLPIYSKADCWGSWHKEGQGKAAVVPVPRGAAAEGTGAAKTGKGYWKEGRAFTSSHRGISWHTSIALMAYYDCLSPWLTRLQISRDLDLTAHVGLVTPMAGS